MFAMLQQQQQYTYRYTTPVTSHSQQQQQHTYASNYTTPQRTYSNINLYSNSTISNVTYNSSHNNWSEISSSNDINYLDRYSVGVSAALHPQLLMSLPTV